MVATEKERVKLNTENPQLKLQVERLTEALRRTEWCMMWVNEGLTCAVCQNYKADGHAPNCIIDAALKQPQEQQPWNEPAPCADCQAAARHAYSDATTPGFFYDKCEKHRAALTQPAAKEEK